MGHRVTSIGQYTLCTQYTQETPYKQYDNVDKVHLKAWPRELTNEVLRLITDTGCPAL